MGEGEPAVNSVGITTSQLQTAAGYAGPFANWRVDVDNADGDGNHDTGVDDVWDFGRSDQYPALKLDLNGDVIPTWEEFGPRGRILQAIGVNGKFEVDQDGLFEIANIDQMAAMALDLSGNGRPKSGGV